LNQEIDVSSCFVPLGLRVTEKHHTSRQMVYIDLHIDADFIEQYTTTFPIPGKPEYFSS
jgi:uncharacterized 2Fe-2S/4Fe-4S cluster protein (DUF4445 family)